jgi:predicted flavoprotein YhiN
LVACPLEVTGKGTFKEEFVTAGGVSLKEIEMKTMQSKKWYVSVEKSISLYNGTYI